MYICNYGKLHTCEISMTDYNKVLGNKRKYEIYNAKNKKLKLTYAANKSGVLLNSSCDSIAAPQLKRSLTISAPAFVPLDAKEREVLSHCPFTSTCTPVPSCALTVSTSPA